VTYRKIPKKINIQEAAAAIKARLLYSEDIDPGIVRVIADIMGVARRTVYAILDGEIKISLDFLHAAVIATNADPQVTVYLEPDGFHLEPDREKAVSDKTTLAEECLDDVQALAKFHSALMTPETKSYQIELARNAVVYELDQNINRWRSDKCK